MSPFAVPVSNAGPEYFLRLFEALCLLNFLLAFFFEMTDAGLHHLIIFKTSFSEAQSNAIANQFARVFIAGKDSALVLMDYYLL